MWKMAKKRKQNKTTSHLDKIIENKKEKKSKVVKLKFFFCLVTWCFVVYV